MHRGERVGSPPRRHRAAAVLAHSNGSSKQRLSRCRSQSDDDARLNDGNLCFEPWEARLDLDRSRFTVDPPWTARHPFEMLHHISHVSPASIDTGLDEAAVEQLAGRADEGMPCSVLDISRLLADQHDQGCLRPLGEDGLSGVSMQVTCRALGSGLAQRRNGWLGPNKLMGGLWRSGHHPNSEKDARSDAHSCKRDFAAVVPGWRAN